MRRQQNRRLRTTVRAGRPSPSTGGNPAVLGAASEAEERPERRTGLEGGLEPAADGRRLALAGSSAGRRPPVVRLHREQVLTKDELEVQLSEERTVLIYRQINGVACW